jgi:hypothetical protein
MLLGVRTYLKLAAGLGLEPRYSAPEADVLPLDDPARMSRIAEKLTILNRAEMGTCTNYHRPLAPPPPELPPPNPPNPPPPLPKPLEPPLHHGGSMLYFRACWYVLETT